MPITDDTTKINALHKGRSRPTPRAFSWDRDGSRRRAAIYADRLDALRHEIVINQRLLDDPRHAERRELLVMRLDETQARAADIAARLIEARVA
jgi:hypothetical protein